MEIESNNPATPPIDTNVRPVWRRLRWIVASSFVILCTIVARPVWHLARVTVNDQATIEPLPPGQVDDASRMNRTAVRDVRHLPVDIEAAEAQLAKLLRAAEKNNWKVSIAGARHSMGGHTIYPGGIVIDMLPLHAMKLDEQSGVLHVQAGAIWSEVLDYLDERGWSVGVMQSNNSFSVGGSISVNCHGWQYRRPPIASTVRALRVMLANGSIVRASRTENAELFSLVLGGYGLFGIILDVDLEVVPNRRYHLDRHLTPTESFASAWKRHAEENPDAAMVFGRLNVAREHFLSDALLYVFSEAPGGSIPHLSAPKPPGLRRQIFRASAESEYGKQLRWQAETKWQPKISGEFVSRNQLLNEGVEVFQNRSADSTDILHEYFVPRNQFSAFVDQVQTIVPRHNGNLLNVTIRSVETDTDTFLRYADQPMFALVMLFHQARTTEGDHRMEAMTRELIEASLALGGRYYLPYRLHATRQQFARAYPQCEEFFARKRKFDPRELFQNQFYRKYGSPNNVGQKTN